MLVEGGRKLHHPLIPVQALLLLLFIPHHPTHVTLVSTSWGSLIPGLSLAVFLTPSSAPSPLFWSQVLSLTRFSAHPHLPGIPSLCSDNSK